ncbi:MAG: hypothetical protein IK131_10440 [Paludibacteraceae bacterium]|nr:hypothetical protein [Paludibacteraceae bacterium]
MENEGKVYDCIKKIADKQFDQKEKINRSDVAFILKDKYGVDCVDGSELSRLVYQAYMSMGQPESIRWAITSNDGSVSIVEQYELDARLEEEEKDSALSIVEKHLGETEGLLSDAKQEIRDVLTIELSKDLVSLHKWLEGTNGVSEVKAKSLSLMQNYGKMVASYTNAEKSVRNDIHDFAELRSSVNSTFLQYANALVDIFGDSIKVVAPQLFDFEQVRYLDVTAMQERKRLEFDKLDENCTLLLGEIASHFNETVSQMPKWLTVGTKVGSKMGVYGSLAVGVVTYLNHWLDAQEKTVRVREEYVQFENGVKKDRQQISGDMMRLATIHKVLNDLYIPRAALFVRRGDEVLSDSLKHLFDSIYTGDVLPLKEERDRLLTRVRELERSINDHSENISLFDAQLVEMKGMLDAQKSKYEEALSRKPEAPGLLSKLLTFGVAQRKYGRRLLEWDEQDGQLVNAYQDTLMDVEEETEDRNSHNAQLEKDKQEYESCKKRIAELNRLISENLQRSPQQKAEALKHLKGILSLLHTGKSVVESKLDDSLLNVYVPPTMEEAVSLPSDIEQNLHKFVGEVCDEIKANGGEVAASVLKEFGLTGAENAAATGEAMASAVDKASELLKNWSYLQTQQMKEQLTDAVYREEMSRLKEEFRTTLSEIDKKNEVLVEILKKANTTTDKEELRKALGELTDTPADKLTEADLEDILSGKKKLEI